VLTRVAKGVLVHESAFLQTNTVVVEGRAGVLLIDPGLRGDELACLANDLADARQTVVAGFSTHPHWDHVLWHARFGPVPRYGTDRCAADLRELLSDPGWKDRVAEAMPPEDADEIPLDLFGLITGLPAGTERVPWDGPPVRIIEHQAHAAGHAALVIEGSRVLVAGDMLSDVLIPFLDLEAADPTEDYLAALRLFDDVADRIAVVIPGHGSAGDAEELRTRIDLDGAYVEALHAADDRGDPRLDPSAPNGSWLPDVHAWQRQKLSQRAVGTGSPG
jgi:glyoxylase-like metal-dependent hydrolase (beta-lactamase superfamily II)